MERKKIGTGTGGMMNRPKMLELVRRYNEGSSTEKLRRDFEIPLSACREIVNAARYLGKVDDDARQIIINGRRGATMSKLHRATRTRVHYEKPKLPTGAADKRFAALIEGRKFSDNPAAGRPEPGGHRMRSELK